MGVRSWPPVIVVVLALVSFGAPARAQSAGGGVAPLPSMPSSGPPSGAPDFAAQEPAQPLAPEAAPSRLSPPTAPADPQPVRPLVSAPELAKPARVPLAKRWWFWAGLGAAAVGVVMAAIFLGPRDPYNGNASPGTVNIF
jgi:hypothetical protein